MGIVLTKAANAFLGWFFGYLYLFLLTSMESLLLWLLWLYFLLAFFLPLWSFHLFILLFYLFLLFVYFMGSSSHSPQNSGYSRVSFLFHEISPNNHVYPESPANQPDPDCSKSVSPGQVSVLSSNSRFQTLPLYSLDTSNATWAKLNVICSLPWNVFLH